VRNVRLNRQANDQLVKFTRKILELCYALVIV